MEEQIFGLPVKTAVPLASLALETEEQGYRAGKWAASGSQRGLGERAYPAAAQGAQTCKHCEFSHETRLELLTPTPVRQYRVVFKS